MDKILVVDDIEINRKVLGEILGDEYEILEAANGVEALDIIFMEGKKPKAILLDVMMPVMDGFETLRRLKANQTTVNIPVLFITATDDSSDEIHGLDEGAVDYITKPFNWRVVKARVDNHVQLQRYRENLEIKLERKTEELIAMHERTLQALANIIEYRSLESGEHVKRTVELTRIMVERLMQNPEYSGELSGRCSGAIIKAAALHDIGKIGIPDNILLKPGKLTPEEFDVIRTHTIIGAQIIESIAKDFDDDADYLAKAREICRSHHERWDGKGYPDNLKEKEIPLSARILSVVDIYDALVSVRCYKSAFSHEEALKIIRQGEKTQFDPGILRAFLEVSDKLAAVVFKN